MASVLLGMMAVMPGIPILPFALLITLINPEYMAPLYSNTAGRFLLLIAALMVSGDTGPTHIASAVGCRVPSAPAATTAPPTPAWTRTEPMQLTILGRSPASPNPGEACAGYLVEGDVDATFIISPLHGAGTVYRGTYREHATGNFLVINDQGVPHPAAFYYLHGTGTGSDGSQIRFTSRGHFVLDKRTGQVRRNTIISTCRVS
jgi:hypothetical protein